MAKKTVSAAKAFEDGLYPIVGTAWAGAALAVVLIA
jgi:hypothetical protein